MTGKNPRWGPVGDQIPGGDGDGEDFFPRNGEWGRDGGRGTSGTGTGSMLPVPDPPRCHP